MVVKNRNFSIIDIIGNTPMVELKNICSNPRIRIMAKLEGGNPGGSVKDRPAYYMIRSAEESGELTKDKIIMEPTSGNTGIALAMIGAAKGYRVKLFMPKCVSEERQLVLAAFGAEVVLSPTCEGTDGAIMMAHQCISEEPDRYYMPNQFDNESNLLAHYETTGPEILDQTDGEIDMFIAGMGTTGTLMGVAKYLRETKPEARVIGVEPTKGHAIQGLKNMKEAIVPKLYKPEMLDDKITIGDEEAYQMSRSLATSQGLFVGMSSGAAVAGALKIAEKLDSGTIVTLLPDRGERYLSTNLFRSMCAKCPP